MTSTQAEPASPGWTPDDSTFGARLALVRQKMGWGNVKQAAEACGLPAESWRTWERDNVTPRQIVQIAATISDHTGCDYGWLLAGQRLQHVGGSIPRYLPWRQLIGLRPPDHPAEHRRPAGRARAVRLGALLAA